MWRIGNSKWTSLDVSIELMIESVCGYQPQQALKFWRLEQNQTLYYSAEYTRTTSRNSYTVCYTQENSSQFGLVNYFVEVHGEFEGHSEQDVFAIISVLNVERFGHCPHMYVAELTGFMKPVLASCIISKCVYVSVSSRVYVGSFPCNVLHVLT